MICTRVTSLKACTSKLQMTTLEAQLLLMLRYGMSHIRLCLSPLLPRIDSNSQLWPTICSPPSLTYISNLILYPLPDSRHTSLFLELFTLGPPTCRTLPGDHFLYFTWLTPPLSFRPMLERPSHQKSLQ